MGRSPVCGGKNDLLRGMKITATVCLSRFGVLHNLPRPVLQRLTQMGRQNILLPRQIRDGARQLQHAMIGSGTQIHLLYCGTHEVFSRFIQFTTALYLRRAQRAPGVPVLFSACIETKATQLTLIFYLLVFTFCSRN